MAKLEEMGPHGWIQTLLCHSDNYLTRMYPEKGLVIWTLGISARHGITAQVCVLRILEAEGRCSQVQAQSEVPS